MTDKKPMNIYQKIMQVRLDWMEANVQKTGINRFAEYTYFELSDIVPVATKLSAKYGLVPMVDFDNDFAYMHVIDAEGEDRGLVTFKSPMKELTVKGMNAIQALGAVETYQRRYLYMMYLDIVEQDEFDATQGKPEDAPAKEPVKSTTATKAKPATKSNRPATAKKRNDVKKDLIDKDGQATDIQIKSIKNGLKKLRGKDAGYEDYIREVAVKMKDGLAKKDAEDLLIEIGKKIEEE